MGPPTHSTMASTHLLTSSHWMGPGWVKGPHCMSWFSSYPSAAHGGVSKLLCACRREGACSHDPPRSTGFWWAGSSKGTGLTRAGTRRAQHQELCTEPSLQSAPSPPVGWSDPEPLRAGPELTIAPGQVSDPGLHMQPPSTKSSRDFHCTWALGPCLHMPPLLSLTPGFLSLGEGLLEITSHLWAS